MCINLFLTASRTRSRYVRGIAYVGTCVGACTGHIMPEWKLRVAAMHVTERVVGREKEGKKEGGREQKAKQERKEETAHGKMLIPHV